MASRYGIPDPPFRKTVYRTPNPEYGISEAYEISIEIIHGAPEPRCWTVREIHGYYDEATNSYHHKVETLHPTGPEHFRTLEEAIHEANQQVLFRAKDGFHFLFTMNFNGPPWYNRFEVVLPAGQIKPLP